MLVVMMNLVWYRLSRPNGINLLMTTNYTLPLVWNSNFPFPWYFCLECILHLSQVIQHKTVQVRNECIKVLKLLVNLKGKNLLSRHKHNYRQNKNNVLKRFPTTVTREVFDQLAEKNLGHSTVKSNKKSVLLWYTRRSKKIVRRETSYMCEDSPHKGTLHLHWFENESR